MAVAPRSIPNVTFIVFDLVLRQYLTVLILERQSAMMFALVGNVMFQIRN